MSQSPLPPNSPSNHLSRLLRIARKPSTIAIGMTSVTIVLIGYTGLRLFLKEYLPPWLEKQVSSLINRPVNIDELQGFSLNRLYLGSSSIPKTPDHPNQLTASRVVVHFDPLAVLLKRTLAIKVVPEDVEVELRQYSEGDLLKGEITDEIIPLKLDLTFDVENVAIDVFLQKTNNLLEATLNGQARYSEVTQAKWNYNLNLALLNSEIELEGQTILETTESQVKLAITKLNLSQLMPLVLKSPLQLNQGDIQADLDLNVPSINNLSKTKGQGTLDLSNVKGQITPFKQPFQAVANISLQDNKVLIKKAQASLGNIIANLSGEYDWNKGSNLDGNITGLTEANIRQVYPIKFPVEVQGELQANFNLTGMFDNPLLKGNIENKNVIEIAQTQLDQIIINFQTNFDDFFLKNFSVKPKVGGEITAQGMANPKILQSLVNGKSIDWETIPFELALKTELPSQKLVKTYYELPREVNLNTLKAQGNIKGNFGNPQGLIKWETAGSLTRANTQIISQGNLLIDKNNIIFSNTELVTNQGKIILSGRGNLSTKKWQGYLNSNSLNLTPFTSVICQNKKIKCPDNISLENANVRMGGTLGKPWKKSVNLSSNLALAVDNGNLVINSQLQQGKFTTSATGLQLPLNALITNIPIPITLNRSKFNLSGNLEEVLQKSTLNIDGIKGDANLEIEIAESPLNAQATWENGLFQGIANLRSLSLNQFVPQLPIPVQLTNSKINILGSLRSLLSLWEKPNFNDFQINTDTQLAIADGTVTAISQLNQGKITVNATATPLSLSNSNLLPQISTPIEVKQTDINLTANLPDLLSFDFNKVQGNAQLKLGVSQGEITTSTQLINNQWTTKIIANNLDLSTGDNQLFSSQISDPINAKINLSGTLASLLSPDAVIPLQANTILLEIGEQKLNADGNLTLTNLLKNPNISTVNLNIDTQADLKILPVNEILAKIPINKQFLPQSIDLVGIGKFKGRLVGKNVLTSPLSPGNLQLIGNLNLSKFKFNDLAFESTLKGEINLITGKELVLDLRGKKDVIAAVFTPCLQQKCLLPYVPQSFEISQREGNSSPIIAQGNRQGDRLIAKVQNLPLELLKLSPIRDYGFPNNLGGKVNLNLEIDPLTLKGRGNLDIINPNLGQIFGDNFKANWIYQDDYLALEKATLTLGNSRYNINGNLRLKTGEIQGNLQVSEGYVQDILTALQISDVESLLRVLQLKKETLAQAESVTPKPVGDVNSPLSEQINKLWKNDQTIRDITLERQAGKLPQELDIRGKFNAEIALAGTLETPKITLQFQGEDWEWTPQLSTPSIIQSLGFVMEGSQVIPIEILALTGKLEDGIIKINPMIKVNQSVIQANLNLSYQNNQFDWQPSTFSLNNLTLDTVRNLMVIPGDINGGINVEGNLTGSLTQPEITGIFSLTNPVINARLIAQNLTGNFSYQNTQFKLQIEEPDFIKVAANFPFPLKEDKNAFQLNAKLGSEIFSLLEVLTEEQVNWIGGDGDIDINIGGEILINQEIKVSLDANSQAILDFKETTFKTDLLPNTLTLNGKIFLQNGTIQVGELIGNIGELTLKTVGILPLFSDPSKEIEEANSLMVSLTQEQVNSDGLYQGIAEARVIITGAAISPIVSGEVKLNQGKIIVPNVIPEEPESPILEEWIGTISPLGSPVLLPRFNHFKIFLQDIEIEQNNLSPKFSFNVSGDLSLSGQLASLSLPGILGLKPSGTVKINSGTVDIPVTRVFLPRQYNNKITFSPNQGLLNPYIDLQFNLYIFNVALRTINANEVADDIVQSGRSQSVEITLGIKGDADQLLPNLGTNVKEVCQLRPDNSPPFPKTPNISTSQLQQLVNCIRVNNLGTNSIQDLLQSPIVSFSSSPRLSSSELLTLFGTQRPDLVEQLQQQNSAQLVEAGLPQVAVVVFPFLQDWIFEFNETTNQFGKDWGLGNLRFYPVLETVYELEDDSLIRFSYDYSFNEVIIRYENKF